MAYTDKIVTNIRQIVANIVQKVTIIVQKVIKIVQLHLLLPAFKPVILITAPHVGRVGFERIRAEYIIKRHYVAESARRVSGGGGGGRGLEMYLKMRYKLTMYLMYLIWGTVEVHNIVVHKMANIWYFEKFEYPPFF